MTFIVLILKLQVRKKAVRDTLNIFNMASSVAYFQKSLFLSFTWISLFYAFIRILFCSYHMNHLLKFSIAKVWCMFISSKIGCDFSVLSLSYAFYIFYGLHTIQITLEYIALTEEFHALTQHSLAITRISMVWQKLVQI